MWKKLLILVMVLSTSLSAWSAFFTAETEGGVMMKFNVVSEAEKTCSVGSVGYNSSAAISTSTEGPVVIPEEINGYRVIGINSRAFKDCSGLTSVTIGNSVTSIGGSAFSGCKSLTSVTIGNSVTSIGGSAFYNCSGLTSVTIGNSVTSIGGYAFYNCSGLTSLSIPDGVTSIGASAFSGCSGLTLATIGNGVDSIGDYAFSGCKSLTSLSIPDGVTSIGNNTFQYCSGLKSVTIGNSVTSIGNNAFKDCSGLTSVTIGNSVTSIRKQAFLGCSGLTSVTIPNSVDSIGGSAFYNCTGLKSVTIGNGVESVGREAFYNCTGLTSVHISDIDSWAKIKFEYNATSNPLYYAEHLYMNGEEVKDIVISDGVDSIGRFAFCHCSGLTSLSIPDGVTSIGGSAFSGCKSLTSVTIGNSVTSIGKYAFSNCSGLTLATIGNGVDSIGDYAFSSCTALSSIQVPEKVEKLGNSVFEGCSALASASLPKGMKNIPQKTFLNCSILTDVTMPDSIKSIGESAFEGCKCLSKLLLPEGLSVIETNAFRDCGFNEMVLPSTLTKICSGGLSGRFIYCPIKEPISVEGYLQGFVLFVPEESVEAYRNAPGWNNLTIMSESNNDADWTEGQVVVNVESAGQLRMAMLERDEDEIRRLKICGSLNSVDLKYLIEGKGIISQLESLDLSDVTLVYDGQCYLSLQYADPDIYFSSQKLEFFLTEERSEVRGSGSLGLSSTSIYRCYGPDLAGVFMSGAYKHIVMPRGITRAASYAFKDCANLQSIEFPQGLNYISTNAFAGCTSLMSLNLEQVDSIGASAFRGCRMFNAENFDKVKHIGNEAFYNCSRLKGSDGVVSLPQCDSIASNAFYGCSNIEKVEFSENLYFLGKKSFMGCKTLETVDLPSSLQALLDETFSGCTALKEVNCPASLLKVHTNAFNNTLLYNRLPVEGGVKYLDNIALCVVDSENLTSIREGTTAIADGFLGKKFSTLSLPSSLLRIGDNAFSSNEFKAIVLPEGLEQIGEQAFYKSAQVNKLTLNESLTEIGSNAFSQCDQLRIVNYNSIDLDVKELFYNCPSLEKVNIGAKVKSLPEGIFAGCTNLVIVKFEERTDDTPFAVGASAFSGCNNLYSIELPSATTDIGADAFSGCWSIKEFALPKPVTVINSGVFYGCYNLSDLHLHDNLKIIGDHAFYSCNYLKKPELPEGLDSIGREAFAKCYYGFTEFTIPSTVTRLGRDFLQDCFCLNKIVSRIKQPKEIRGIVDLSRNLIWELYGTAAYDQHYYEMYSKITLVVPAGSINRYRQTGVWSRFANVVEEASDMTEKNFLTVAIDTVSVGSVAQLAISLQNNIEDFTAYQFDLNLPVGIEMEINASGRYKYVMSDRNSASHTITVEKLQQLVSPGVYRNRYRFVCISAQNATIKGTSGVLLEVPLIVNETMDPGDYEAQLENVVFTQQNGTENGLLVANFGITLLEAPDFKFGDANMDGIVNVSDIVSVLNYIMQHPEGDFNEEAADANRDGEINIVDVVTIVNIIMGK